MTNINIEKTIKDNTKIIKDNVKDLLILEVLQKEVKEIINKNQKLVLNYFDLKNRDYLKHKNEPEFIKNHKQDYYLIDDDFYKYWDIVRILNLKNNLYTKNKDFGPDLVLQSEIINKEYLILNLFFEPKQYIKLDIRKKFLNTIKSFVINHYNINTNDLLKDTKKFKIFGTCDWNNEFIKEFSIKYQDDKEVLNFLNSQGFNLKEVL